MPQSAQPSAIPISPLARILTGRAAQAPQTPQTPPSASSTLSTSTPQPAQQTLRPVGAMVESRAESRAESPLPGRADITHSGVETTQELDALLLKGTSSLRRGLAEVAYSSFHLHEKADWASLGFAGEAEYFTSRGYSESTWDSYLLLGERLSSLTLDEMREIPTATARLIATISTKIWPEFAWVEEARILPAREFALLVQERRAQAKGKKLVDPKAMIELAVPMMRKDEFERRMDSLRRREQLPSAAATLDFALRSAEREPSRAGAAEMLDQAAEELLRLCAESLEDVGERDTQTRLEIQVRAQELSRQIQKSLKELRKGSEGSGGSAGNGSKSPSLPIEVARDQNSHRTDPAQA